MFSWMWKILMDLRTAWCNGGVRSMTVIQLLILFFKSPKIDHRSEVLVRNCRIIKIFK